MRYFIPSGQRWRENRSEAPKEDLRMLIGSIGEIGPAALLVG